MKTNQSQSKLEKAVQKILRLSSGQNLLTFEGNLEQKGEINPNKDYENKNGVRVLMGSNTFYTLETTLKNSDIKNNATTSQIQNQEQMSMSSTNEINGGTTTITLVANARQNEELPDLGDFLLLDEDVVLNKQHNGGNAVELCVTKSVSCLSNQVSKVEDKVNDIENKNRIREDKDIKNGEGMEDEKIIDEEKIAKLREDEEKIENLIDKKEENKRLEEGLFDIENDDENNDTSKLTENVKNENKNVILIENDEKINKKVDNMKSNNFEEEKDETMESIEELDNVINVNNTEKEEKKNGNLKEDKIIEELSKEEKDDDKVVVSDKIVEKNVLVEEEIEKVFQECFVHLNYKLENVSIEETAAKIVLTHSNMESAELTSHESTLAKINQSIQLVKNMDGQEHNKFVECVFKIVQCTSEKAIVPHLPNPNSLEIGRAHV